MQVITKGQYGGGTCLEISAERGNNVVLARYAPQTIVSHHDTPHH